MKPTRVRNLFVALAIIAFGQVLWWASLLINQQHALDQAGVPGLDPGRFTLMVIFEGLFFMFVWVVGMWFAYRSFREQAVLKKAHLDFVGAVTHELKTPITNIQLCLDTLERPSITEEMKKRYIERANQALRKLLNNVEAILAFDGSGSTGGVIQRVDLHEILTQCVEQLDPQGDRIEFQGCSGVEVMAPNEEARLILHNLIDNAVKYSGSQSGADGARVRIEVQQEGAAVLVKIVDHGSGFTPDELQRAFEPFWRSPRAIEQAKPGTGVGLALAKNLAERAGAEISIRSPGKNQGTEAQVKFQSVRAGPGVDR